MQTQTLSFITLIFLFFGNNIKTNRQKPAYTNHIQMRVTCVKLYKRRPNTAKGEKYGIDMKRSIDRPTLLL
jgi:hypothetical protein